MPDETRDLFTQGLDTWQIAYTEQEIKQFLTYRDLLIDWNSTRMNLTRLVTPREIAVDHFLDSLSLTRAVHLPFGCTLLDIGAGAGFPSLPLKILRPDLTVTLLEATAKKLLFCREVVSSLGMDRINFEHGRAEQAVPKLNRRFDIVTARGVASLDRLIPWCEPYLKSPGGIIAALKGSRASDEVAAARQVLGQLKLRAEIVQVDVPGSEKDHNIVICRR